MVRIYLSKFVYVRFVLLAPFDSWGGQEKRFYFLREKNIQLKKIINFQNFSAK